MDHIEARLDVSGKNGPVCFLYIATTDHNSNTKRRAKTNGLDIFRVWFPLQADVFYFYSPKSYSWINPSFQEPCLIALYQHDYKLQEVRSSLWKPTGDELKLVEVQGLSHPSKLNLLGDGWACQIYVVSQLITCFRAFCTIHYYLLDAIAWKQID